MGIAKSHWSRVLTALLLSLCLTLPACADDDAGGSQEAASPQRPETTGSERTSGVGPQESEASERGGTTIETLTPDDVLSEEDTVEAPKYEDWYADSDAEPQQSAEGGSAGSIPTVKPYNFGRDPGGPADKTLYLTVPKLGLYEVPVFDSVEEERLRDGAIHVPATGFPWQEGANTYIAGHRIGYPGTPSDHVFYDLEELVSGDDIILRDAAGGEYVYRVTEQTIVPPDNVEVMNAVPGRSIVSLQTCTLPDYAERVVVRGELV